MNDATQGHVEGIVLAAGASSRMGTPKALLDANGRSFLKRLVEVFLTGGCDHVTAVVRAGAEAAFAEGEAAGAAVVVNDDIAADQMDSLRRALAASMSRGGAPPSAVLFTPVDHPMIEPTTVRALITAWRATRPAIAVPVDGGVRGHPVLMDASVYDEVLGSDAPDGARSVVRREPERVLRVPVSDVGIHDDLDTPADYRRRFPHAPEPS